MTLSSKFIHVHSAFELIILVLNPESFSKACTGSNFIQSENETAAAKESTEGEESGTT